MRKPAACRENHKFLSRPPKRIFVLEKPCMKHNFEFPLPCSTAQLLSHDPGNCSNTPWPAYLPTSVRGGKIFQGRVLFSPALLLPHTGPGSRGRCLSEYRSCRRL